MKASEALRFALARALAVLWGGLVAAGLYLTIVLMGPTIEGRYFPVVENYRLIDFRPTDDGAGVQFRASFVKVRDCAYYGVYWYAPDPEGNFVRLQVQQIGRDPVPPTTGPMGPRVSMPQAIFPPAGSQSIVGVMNHDCGLVWQTRTIIGPFDLANGKPIDAPIPSGL